MGRSPSRLKLTRVWNEVVCNESERRCGEWVGVTVVRHLIVTEQSSIVHRVPARYSDPGLLHMIQRKSVSTGSENRLYLVNRCPKHLKASGLNVKITAMYPLFVATGCGGNIVPSFTNQRSPIPHGSPTCVSVVYFSSTKDVRHKNNW